MNHITIVGYRGFAREQKMTFAVPNGELGSGLTLITGSNNSGKSSLLESLRARAGSKPVSFTTGVRNASRSSVSIVYHVNGKQETLATRPSSSEAIRDQRDDNFEIYVLPSRRAFDPYFSKMIMQRRNYLNNNSLPAQRASTLGDFSGRLFKILESPNEFNAILKKVIGFEPNWTIDLTDQGAYYLKFIQGQHSHSSDGLGEGIVSLFAIVDALYDSAPGNMVVIDEPELSLHPSLQKRTCALLLEYARDRQIVISTHSPYFVALDAIAHGAHLVRVVNDGQNGSAVYELSQTSKSGMQKLLSANINNPHVFGLDAKELFFQEDGIVLAEGQEDVVLFPQVARSVGLDFPGALFGWGVGGASNMELIATVLSDLGFKKVAGLLDADRASDATTLASKFPSYHFSTIAARDIRTKKPRKEREEIIGLLDEHLEVRGEFAESTKQLLEDLSRYLAS